LDVSVGQRVVIEFCLAGFQESLTVRGEVNAVETSTLRGAWIEVFSLRLFEGLRILGSAPPPLFRRLPADLPVRAPRARPPRAGRLSAMAGRAEVSAGGARIVSPSGAWRPGEEIFVSALAGGPSLCADVVWSRDSEVAIRFRREEATTRRNAVRLVESALER